MTDFNDAKYDALIALGYVGTVADMEALYLQDKILLYDVYNREYLWDLFLDQEGIDPGALNGRKFSYFKAQGAESDQLNEAEIEFWQSL